ncbi:MAG TPA: hypothetical protein PLY04_18135 [bacterium]|nr:hypothetical protein [bacterium]
MPALLELALNCENYRALPYSGGVMDQPAGLLRKMRQVTNVYEAARMYKREGNKPGESAKWKREHQEVWDIVDQVEKLRAKYG